MLVTTYSQHMLLDPGMYNFTYIKILDWIFIISIVTHLHYISVKKLLIAKFDLLDQSPMPSV